MIRFLVGSSTRKRLYTSPRLMEESGPFGFATGSVCSHHNAQSANQDAASSGHIVLIPVSSAAFATKRVPSGTC